MVPGLPVARLAWSLPATSGSVVWLPHGRKEAGIRMLSFVPATTRTRDLLLRSSVHGRR
jgi:hypothetical protein